MTFHDTHDHYCAARRAQSDRVSTSGTRTGATSQKKWIELYACLTFAPELSVITNPITYLQIFAYQVRMGDLAASRASAKKLTMEGYLRDLAHTFFRVGTEDPRLDHLE